MLEGVALGAAFAAGIGFAAGLGTGAETTASALGATGETEPPSKFRTAPPETGRIGRFTPKTPPATGPFEEGMGGIGL